MPTLSPAQIYALARQAGLGAAAATTATAIALAESGGRTDAQGDVGIQDAKWGPSIGLWQIRSLKAEYGTGGPRDASRLTDPQFNARSMVEISGGGKNWRPWSVFLHGTYRAQLPKVTAGVESMDLPTGGFSDVTESLGEAVDAINPLDGWAADAFAVGLKILGAGAAAALVIVGAVHTVKQ